VKAEAGLTGDQSQQLEGIFQANLPKMRAEKEELDRQEKALSTLMTEATADEAGIAQAMIGMLHAIPKTPLHARLAAEGRIDDAGLLRYGTNLVPARMSRAALRDGYVRLMDEIYQPDAYFARLATGLGTGQTPFAPARARYWQRHPLARVTGQARNLVRAAVLYQRLMRHVDDPGLRRRYRAEVSRQWRRFRDPGLVFGYLVRCAMHYHHFTLAGSMARRQSTVVNSF